tara:strand:- start:1559 stop:2305 length:747 start_codon:yes stop_codon:yes gene_type:complete
MKVPGILKNKYVLYVLLVAAIVNILGYLAIQDYNSLALFVIIGLLSTYFSKNMSINLLVAILVTSVVAVNKKVQEGFEEKMKEEGGDEVQSQIKNVMANLNKTVEKAGDVSNKSKCDPACEDGKVCNDNGKCVKKSGFQNNVPPSSPAPVNDDNDESVGDRIDYAATMEQAYNNLHKMLGEDGMNSITSETKKLVSQQKDLMGTLNQMAPILNTAKETLSGLNLGDMGDMSKMLKDLQGGAPPKIGKK